MEHQTCVAYGNHYLGGYRGRAFCVGLNLISSLSTESAHEWGNSVTDEGYRDMWIHESSALYGSACVVPGSVDGHDEHSQQYYQYAKDHAWDVRKRPPNHRGICR